MKKTRIRKVEKRGLPNSTEYWPEHLLFSIFRYEFWRSIGWVDVGANSIINYTYALDEATYVIDRYLDGTLQTTPIVTKKTTFIKYP